VKEPGGNNEGCKRFTVMGATLLGGVKVGDSPDFTNFQGQTAVKVQRSNASAALFHLQTFGLQAPAPHGVCCASIAPRRPEARDEVPVIGEPFPGATSSVGESH